MQQLNEFEGPAPKYFFTDIDDTMTDEGELRSDAYSALWKLKEAGLKVVPVTGRPAGWCEMIARFWPVDGVIGENGAFYFRYHNKKMNRHFVIDEATRLKNRKKLDEVVLPDILKTVPGCAVASDQFTRLMDLAIDFCEDVKALPKPAVQKIVDTFIKHGAIAKVSSIHVNGWFGNYDKLSTCKTFLVREFNETIIKDSDLGLACFVGDSPNDEPMFKSFPLSFAVSNIERFVPDLAFKPKYVARRPGGLGFSDIVKKILDTKQH
jgi:HAD superfamily hydrolase (TIGR01484 family)